MMKQAVKDRGGSHPVPEHFAPSAEALVAGQDHRSALVAPADELEEQIGTLPVNGRVADLVHDQQPGRGVELELVIEPAFGHASRKAFGNRAKLYSRHAPEVQCISKGKSRKQYEFGVKVGLAITLKGNLIVGVRKKCSTRSDSFFSLELIK